VINEDDDAGGGDVEAHAACPRREQQHRHIVAACKVVKDGLAFFGRGAAIDA